MIAAIFTVAFAAQVVRMAVPYVLSALGGSITERSGMIDLALEAKLLFGAFAAAAVGHATNSALAGIAAGIAAGVLVSAIQVLFSLVLGADHAIVGIALNLLALGGTRFLLQLIFHEGANSPPAPSYGDVVRDVRHELAERVRDAKHAGVDESLILIDPSLGFAKTNEQSTELVQRIRGEGFDDARFITV